ncbi:uncharacterized protein LOC134786894 [Penaeus indicus]|uniref:uncharacterized protein LOC134786894 n=1 Tax=Penaeus indicus TaxID=29960 RepID=UPI00300D927D
MITFLVIVSTALVCSHAFAARSYSGLPLGTPLGGFSQHGTLHGGFIPGGLYDNGASLVNHGLSLGHLPGPIYRDGGYLDYAYSIGEKIGNPYGSARFLKYLYGNRLGLTSSYGGLPNVRVGGISEAEDERSSDTGSESGLGATNDADFVSNNQNLASTQNGVSSLHSSPIATSGVFPSVAGPYKTVAGLSGFPYNIRPYISAVGLERYLYGPGPLTTNYGLEGFSYGVGQHTGLGGLPYGVAGQPSLPGSGGFPSGLTHDTPIAALDQQYRFLSSGGPRISVGALGGFPYGLESHTPFTGFTGFPYGLESHTPFTGFTGFPSGLELGSSLGGFHSGPGPYNPVAYLDGSFPDLGMHTTGLTSGRFNPGQGLYTPRANQKSFHSSSGSRHSSNASSENKNKKAKKTAKN